MKINWWADSMERYCYLRNVQDLLSDGKTPYERRFGEPFNGTVIPFGSMAEYHPISGKDLSRLHQLVLQEGLTRIVSGLCIVRGGLAKKTYWSQTWRNWRRWTHRKSTRKDSMQRKC